MAHERKDEEGRPSTHRRSSGEASRFDDAQDRLGTNVRGVADAGDDAPFHAVPTKHREAQIKRRPERKRFDRKAKEDFLGWYAASGNCVWAAEKAGFNDGTVWRHRASDPDFAEAFDRAAEQGIARAKVTMLESKMRAKPYRIEEGREAPEFEVDPEIAMRLVVEHERAGGRTPGRRGKQGRAPRVASNAEVDAALTKRMKAYLRRLQQGGASGWAADGEGERG